MYLKRLEIQGFKSFAQKTTMEFSQGIIAIVGPNGSGKSNAADCLRWVLGEQSAKLMRGKKNDDVIFAGSDKKTRLGFAEVTATFDNRDHRIPVDSPEVSIGRRVSRSGESEYLINGNKVRLLDIVDLVLKSNIGTSRYTVIGQGTIDQMILAGPMEVKSLIDEASGVKTYYIKRERTLRRLEQTAQNLMRAEDLMAEIEPRLKSLRRQAKRMEARAEIETELKVYQREFFGNTYWMLKKQINNFLGQILQIDGTKNQLEKSLVSLRTKAEQFETSNAEKMGAFKQIQEQLLGLQNQKNKLLEDLSLVRGKMQSQKTSTTGDAKTLQVTIHEVEVKIAGVSIKIQETESWLEARRVLFNQQSELLVSVNQKLEYLYTQAQNPATTNWEALEKEVIYLEDLFLDIYEKLKTGTQVQEVISLAENFKTNFVKFKDSAKKVSGSNQAQNFQNQLQLLLKEKDVLNTEVSGIEVSLSQASISIEFLNKELATLMQQKLQVGLEITESQSESPDDFISQLIVRENQIQSEVENLAEKITKLEDLFKSQSEQENYSQKQLHEIESEFRKKQDDLSRLKDQAFALNIEKTKFDTQMEVLKEEVRRILGEEILGVMADQEVASVTTGLEEKIMRLKNQLDMIGGMDELTLKEYQETENRFVNLSTQVQDLKQGMQDLKNIMDELDVHIKQKFNEAFHKINEKFEYYFRILFNGGRAYLSVLKEEESKEDMESSEGALENDTTDKGHEGLRVEEKLVKKYERGVNNVMGIDIKATPPNKKLSSIQALSGGERALTSIALLCSLLTCFPSPFVVLDEVDAALDDANTIRFGQILGTLAHQTQFITITHNRETMAQANILYGVTMGDDGISKLLSVKLEQAKQYAK